MSIARVMPKRRIERIMPRRVSRATPADISILDAIDDRHLFGQHFKLQDDWFAWRTFLATLFGIPLDKTQLKLFRECTGREHPPDGGSNEAWIIVGRRGRKSFTLALIAVYLACFRDWRPYLGPGERATIPVIAADRKQARTVMRYVKGLLSASPMLAKMVIADRAEAVDLERRVTIEVHSASYRTTRGYAIPAALLDEIAFFSTEDSAEPDVEILNAPRPGMATFPHSMLLAASSPHARRGELWHAYRKHHGKDGDPILVWQAPTRVMNSRVPQSVIDAAMESDPARASAEFGAVFRTDVETYITREAVEACVALGCYERAPCAGVTYYGFIDPSGGSSDSMTLAVAHKQDKCAVLDCIREIRPPFSPDAVVSEFAALFKSYRISKIKGDRFGGEWVKEPFRKYGITYELSEKPKNDIYQNALPLINSKRADLLDHQKLINQLVSLERRTARGGRDRAS